MAMTLVGGAFLSASLQVLFDRMASRGFINFFWSRKHDERLLNKMKIMLLAVKPLLNDAELKQWTDTAVKDWVDELKDVIYHADDLLDEISSEAMLSKLDYEFPTSSTTTTTQAVRDFVSGSSFCEGLASRIEQIIDRLEYFVNAKDSLGLREFVGRNNLSHRLPTSSLVDHLCVYGRDDDKDKIIQLLISDDSSGYQISVIPIVGMVGVGKTTLAQLVYNDARVDDHFDIKLWVCVSEEFDVLRVTKIILEGLTRQTCYTNDLNLLQVDLMNNLAGKKFVIVLDDVWNENINNWDILRVPFGVGKHGSKIVVTTRNEGVASIMRNVPIFRLQQLSHEDCWLLFSKQAFENVSSSVLPNLEPIGRKIVEKCKGLPLAVKTLSALLRYKVEVEEWMNVLESHLWDFPNEKSDILPALLLSYHHLPSHLKLCFAYCAIIPKDYAFTKDELVPLWIAEGFVQWLRTSRRIEEIGDDYFHELTSRSLFQQSHGNKFLMHDLINDLAQFVAGEYCFRLADDRPHDISKVRYFSYFIQRFDAVAKLKAIREGNCIRTFTPWIGSFGLTKSILHDVLPTLRCLRVLSLSGYCIVELPDSIGNLIHLRYLDLSYTKIRRLPETISRLCNLETLLLRACSCVTSLPTYLCKLICLRHLDISGTSVSDMPMQIGKLRSLQRLTKFIVGNQTGSAISELRELHYLRGTLSISNLQNLLVVRDALEASLKNKKHLQKLNLEWVAGHTDDSQKEMEVLEKLQPHINLKHLTIENYGGTRFPDWLGNCSFFNLKSLYLCSCTNCFELPPLGQLPTLQELTIKGMNKVMKVGSEFYGYESSWIKPFHSLEKLKFEEMLEWEEWSMLGAGEFCHLLELRISNCPKLIGNFPKHLQCLKKLEIRRCQHPVIENILKLDDDGQMVTDSATGAVPIQHLSSLQLLVIESISELQSLPLELCRLTNLEELSVSYCPMLNTIQIIEGDHRSFSFQPEEEMKRVNTKLRSLKISNCPELELPLSEDTEHYYKFLQDLTVMGRSCDSLTSLPLDFFPKLRALKIDECRNFESLSVSDGIQNLTSLQSLCISNCPNMVSFAERGLPARNLTEIRIHSCKKLKALPEQMCTLLPVLQSLHLEDLPELELPLNEDSEHHYKFLQNLTIDFSCDSLKSFPLGFFPKLRSLQINGCKNFESLSALDGLQNLTSLQSLHILLCPNLVSFAGGLPAPNLTEIRIWSCTKLKALPEGMCTLLPSLQSLKLTNLPEIESFPLGGLPYSLISLTISHCDKLMARRTEWGLQRFPSLRVCVIQGECEEDKLLESFPQECLLPTSLTHLRIKSRPNLKSLNTNGLRHLNSLEELVISDCPKLQSLPNEGLPSSLLDLIIWDCPLLKVRCQREKGEDWHKISHIPYIQLDHEVIGEWLADISEDQILLISLSLP